MLKKLITLSLLVLLLSIVGCFDVSQLLPVKEVKIDKELENKRSQQSIEQYSDLYPEALRLMDEGKYFEAIKILRNLADYKDGRKNYAYSLGQLKKFSTSSGYHTLGVKSDGTVLATGLDEYGMLDVGQWRDVVRVETVHRFGSLGLRRDGKVVSTNGFDISNWKDIIDIAAGSGFVLGLKKDGTVLATGYNDDGQCNVSQWNDIVAISGGIDHSIGLKSDGTVVAVGKNDYGQCNISDWRNIVAIAAGGSFSLGLRSDGTVLAFGLNANNRCDLEDWHDMVYIGAGGSYSYGITKNGTVLTTDRELNVKNWTDIVYVDSGFNKEGGSNMIGLRNDGTLVFTGDNTFKQCNVKDWNLSISSS